MRITVDTAQDSPEELRFAAAVLMSLASGDLSGEDTPQPDKPAADAGAGAPPPPGAAAPPPPSNVLPFQQPSPPAPLAGTAAPPPPGAAAPSAAAAPPAASAPSTLTPTERDKAGLPWDARIHQRARGKKKDGTWKLLKNIDPKVVEAVVRELSTAALPANAAPAPVSLQPAVSVPPPPVGAAAPPVSVPQPPSAPVPAPPAGPAAGDAPAVAVPAFRLLVDKIASATRDSKLSGERVSQIVQAVGAPNLQALFGLPHLIPAVEAQIDAAILGL